MPGLRPRPLAARCAPALLLCIAFAAGCGSAKNSANAAAAATKAGQGVAVSSAAQAVEIKSIAFPPSVSVKPGASVTWTNRDGVSHTVSADAGATERFDSQSLAPNATFTMTFAKVGAFAYHCNIHASMHGVIVVGDQAGGAGTPASATPAGRPASPYYKY